MAKEVEDQANFNIFVKDAMADMFEHVYKVFTLKNTDTMIAAQEARLIAYWATICVGLKNKQKYLSGRTMYNESFKLKSLPKGYEQNVCSLLSLNTDVQSLKDSASELWVSTHSWADKFGVRLEEIDLAFL
ncbi:kanamycin nucleotidyltransferase C-terminal domain-containing protein [Bacillus sp. SCS-151]|uniref:kanamycin nucleotidyltransferase C-terminal domain-containing protein n=1 Tax=Nanhaiella sioensis TaxID=3115293 RepID=UPI00397990A5